MLNWNECYLQNQTPWDRGEASPFLEVCLSRLRPGVEVIVPGCGAGYEVAVLAEQGYQVWGLDLAEQALALAKSKLDHFSDLVTLAQVDVLSWIPPTPVQAVYEQTCLCALSPESWPVYARQLHQWLAPGGSLFAAFMQTHAEGGPPFHCDLENMLELFPKSLWSWSEQLLQVDKGPGRQELGFVLTRV